MLRYAGLAMLLLAAFGWGFSVGAYDLFPYPQARQAKTALFGSAEKANSNYDLSEIPTISAERYALLETKADIVMVGDSITASGRWKELFPQASIINRGVPGDRVGGVLKRVDAILQAEPTKVFVMVGINDVAAHNTNTQIIERYEMLVDRLIAGNAKVYIQSVIACRATKYGPCDAQMRQQIGALNASLKRLAIEKSATFLDVNTVLQGKNGVSAQYSIDGVHPSSAGFARWSELLSPYLKTTVATEPEE